MSLEASIYSFGNFTLDADQKVLFENGKPVSITPKALNLLSVLVECHGKIVEKEILLSEVWPDSFVEDSNLTFNIRQLRKTLGDRTRNPRFIETVPRRGYRFIADVQRSNGPDPVQGQQAAFSRSNGEGLGKRRIAYLAVGGAGLVIIGLFAMSRFFGPAFSSSPPLPIFTAPFKSEKLTSSGNVFAAAISPSGEYAAYVDAVGKRQSLWLRRLDIAENIQILPPMEEQYFSIVFSNDGRSLFFLRKPSGGREASIFRVGTFGGIPEKIVEGADGFFSLSPDDRLLSFTRCGLPQTTACSLLVAAADGKNERILVTRSAPVLVKVHKFSPDGQTIAFAAGNSGGGASDQRLFLIDVAGGAEREIASRTFFDIKAVEWVPGGGELLFSAKELLDEKVSIWKLRLADGETTRLVDDPNNYFTLGLSGAGDKLVSTQVTNNHRLIILTDQGERQLVAARDFAFGPDGKVVYASDDRDIWSINPDGSGQRQLTRESAADFSPIVSPDNRYVYFTSNRTGSNQIWRMDADGSNQMQITKNEGGYPRQLSPDGRWVFYLSGTTERLRKVSTETGDEIQLSERRFFVPQISPDGQYVADFVYDKIYKIGLFRIADEKMIKTFDCGEGTSRSFAMSWQPDSKAFYFVSEKGEKNLLWRQAIDKTSAELIAEIGTDSIEKLSGSPDGKALAFTRGRWVYDAVLIRGLR